MISLFYSPSYHYFFETFAMSVVALFGFVKFFIVRFICI